MEICPCCGFKGLKKKPYANMPSISETRNKPVPYEDLWGMASYEVCLCCGYEFGFEDDPGEGIKGETFEEVRKEWIENGCEWFDPSAKPPGWSVREQLKAAGLEPSGWS